MKKHHEKHMLAKHEFFPRNHLLKWLETIYFVITEIFRLVYKLIYIKVDFSTIDRSQLLQSIWFPTTLRHDFLEKNLLSCIDILCWQ